MHFHAFWTVLVASIVSIPGSRADLDEVSHEDSHLLSIFPATEDHHVALKQFMADRSGCEFLKYPRIQGLPVDIICHGSNAGDLTDHLESLRMPFFFSCTRKTDDDDDDEDWEEEEDGDIEKEDALNNNIQFSVYNRYDKIQAYLKKLAYDYKSFVKLETAKVKKSYENRNLQYLKIGTSPQGVKTKLVWIEAGIHAREWISVTIALYIIDKLVRVFNKKVKSETLTAAEQDLVSVDWYIMPLLNPDGYEYSHTKTTCKVRLWRKNRVPVGKGCYGVDLNRNFNVVGYGTGDERSVSRDPCKESYIGKAKGSELEVKMASEVVMKNKDKIKVALAFHSFGSYILTPWCYTNTTPPDSEQMVGFANRLYAAIKTVNPLRKYTVGPSAQIFFYTAGGTALDYYKAVVKIPYVATFEFPGYYTNEAVFPAYKGFHPPTSHRLLISRETWGAMHEVAKTARNTP